MKFNKDLNVSFSAKMVSSTEVLLSFEVDGSYDLANNPNRIAITRWLYKEFRGVKAAAKANNLTVKVQPYDGDSNYSYRYNALTKLGFVNVDAFFMTLQS